MIANTLDQPANNPPGRLAQLAAEMTSGKPAGRKPTRKEERAAFWRMLALIWPHRKAMAWGMILGLGVALAYAASLGGLLPVLKVVVEEQSLHDWFIEKATKHPEALYSSWCVWLAGYFPADNSAQARWTSLLILMGVLLGMNILGNVCRCFSQYLVLYASQRAMMDVRRAMYRKALHRPMVELARELSDRTSQFMSDTREMFLGITTLFGKVIREPLKAVCVLAVALFMDWKLTLAVLALIPPAVGILWYFGRKVRKAAVRLLQGYGFMLGNLAETLQGLETVKGYGREAHERRRMWNLERQMLGQQLRLSWIEAFSSPLIEVVGVVGASAAIVWLAAQIFFHGMDRSQFMTMAVLIAAMLDPVRKIANVYNMVQRSGGAATRVFSFLDEPEQRSEPNAVPLPPCGTGVSPVSGAEGNNRRDAGATIVPAGRAIRFENVRFRYNPDDPLALTDVNLTVQPGECLAIVGPNGSGKSTLMKLLPRLLEPQEGTITIDGLSLTEITLPSLRTEIAVVSQRPVIFARSVRENLAYGNENATTEQIRDAARRAYAAEFIESWPDQYETRLGQFGTNISGGQRQRMAIARAFLKPASILIFDEATSEIDAESEHKIHAALNELRKGKTTFLIAHRHTVMEMAERIVVMDAGRIVDVGTHTELLSRCPLYIALYRSPAAK